MGNSIVTEIGSMVPEFRDENVIILFGPMATPDLREICVIHDFQQKPDHSLVVGKKILLGNHTYTIKQVGSEANKNFEELGHISIYFRQNSEEVLPGAIEVEPAIFPDLEIGDKVIF